MEEMNSEMNKSGSCWKLKQQALRSQRNFRQLENRMVVLQLQRQAAVKAIEIKLQQHKKHMEVRLDRHQLRQIIQQTEKSKHNDSMNNSRVFQDVRAKRAFNIRNNSCQIRINNHQLFRQAKRQRLINQQLARQQKQRQIKTKVQKRNKVRLLQIVCKQNVNKYWINRLDGFQHQRQKEVAFRIQEEAKRIQQLINLQKSQQELLGKIRQAEQMDEELSKMMTDQRELFKSKIQTIQ